MLLHPCFVFVIDQKIPTDDTGADGYYGEDDGSFVDDGGDDDDGDMMEQQTDTTPLMSRDGRGFDRGMADPSGILTDEDRFYHGEPQGGSLIASDWAKYNVNSYDEMEIGEGGGGTTSGDTDDIQSVASAAFLFRSSGDNDSHDVRESGYYQNSSNSRGNYEPRYRAQPQDPPPTATAHGDYGDDDDEYTQDDSFLAAGSVHVRSTGNVVSFLDGYDYEAMNDDDDDDDVDDVDDYKGKSTSDATPPVMNRSTVAMDGPSMINLTVVSSILDKSLLPTDGGDTIDSDAIKRKMEGWDADIKTAVSNLNLLHGFPRGLAFNAARKSRSFLPLRLWLVDNHFGTCQGDELRDCLDHHISIAETMEVSSVFCLLNSMQEIGEFSVSPLTENAPFSLLNTTSPTVSGTTAPIHDDTRHEMHQMIQLAARGDPTRAIPWAMLLQDAARQIERADTQLNFHQQTIVVCLVCDVFDVTDDIASELFLLQHLPITFIVRLVGTTGREAQTILDLRDKFHSLGLRRSVRVLGDWRSHQILVRRANPWLNYAIPLHRCQEMGLQSRTVGLLEERLLNHNELREFLVLLFGRHVMLEAPDAMSEWPAFMRYIKFVNESANKDSDGFTKSTEPWLDIAELDRLYRLPEAHSIIQAVHAIREQTRRTSASQVEL
jgi:hypothetical protein